MRIGELAARTGVSVRSLRYYEEQGLLTSVRSPSGQRHYSEDAVGRVIFLQRLYAAGLSSRTILDLLPCVDSPSTENTEASLARVVHERDLLGERIAELQRTRDSLNELIAVSRAHRQQQLAEPDQPT